MKVSLVEKLLGAVVVMPFDGLYAVAIELLNGSGLAPLGEIDVNISGVQKRGAEQQSSGQCNRTKP